MRCCDLPRFTRLALFSLLLTGPGCNQSEGERCEVNSDCESPLICEVTVSGSSSGTGVNGICRPRGSTTGADAAGLRDAPVLADARPDARDSRSDSSPSDGASSDLRSLDTLDAGLLSIDASHDLPSVPDSSGQDTPQAPDGPTADVALTSDASGTDTN